MLNKIMMSCRLLSEPAVTTKDDPKYCKFSIAVEQPKQKGVEDVESDTFTCLAFDDNASAVSFSLFQRRYDYLCWFTQEHSR